ncbi:site-2 protease family protein [Halovulum dunhuangense]|uniref:site-2 protease family protein n=1 Tax=Halovulum dunhuangense TaxID=1505036 RepID=UPI0031B5AFA6
MAKTGLHFVNLFGLRINLSPSWFLVAALVVWSLSQRYFPDALPGLGRWDYVWIGVLAMLGLFGSLVLHELAHALVARQNGVTVGGITLFLFGGVAELKSEPGTPGAEFRIAAVGPAMSLALALGMAAAAALARRAGLAAPVPALLDYLSLANLVLALFNLLPAFPLDGGRILRAGLWRLRGNPGEATRISGAISQAIAWGLILLGFLSLFAGGSVDALWLILIGFFLATVAASTVRQIEMRVALDGRMVSQFMTRNVITADPRETLREMADRVMLGRAASFVPVVERGRLMGFVDIRLLRGIDREHWDDTHVDDIFVACTEENTVPPDMPSGALLERILAGGPRKYLVARGSRLEGVVTLSDLLHFLGMAETLRSGVPAHCR